MRSMILAGACLVVLGVSAFLGAKPDAETATVRLRLESWTRRDMPGIIRAFPKGSNKPLALAGLFDRLRGLDRSETVAGWYVLPAGGADVTLPRGEITFEALSGLETMLTRREIDLRNPPKEIKLIVQPIFFPEDERLAAGNTHLHLRGMPLKDADEYLRQIPAADGLKVMFISYLERHKDDETYITNRYPVGDLKQFAARGVLFNNGDNDITDAVIKQLNANAPAGSLKPVDPKPEKAEDRKEEKKK